MKHEKLKSPPKCDSGNDMVYNRKKGYRYCSDRYNCPTCSQKIIEQTNKTNQIRFGSDRPIQNKEIKEKAEQTNILKCGHRNVFANDEIKQKIKEKYKNDYGCSHPSQLHLSESQLEKLGDNSFMRSLHHDKKFSCNVIASILGVEKTTIHDYMNRHGIEILRFARSGVETILSHVLENLKINFIQGDRNLINPLELDFYIPEHSVAIEINGLYWHSEKFKDKNYHHNKYELCKEKGITLLQFWDFEVNKNLDIVISMITSNCGLNKKRIYARKTRVVELNDNDCLKFLDKNHLQGRVKSSTKLGLIHDNDIVGVMTFDYKHELTRFCTLNNVTVVGGASKLMKHYTRTKNPGKIISFSDNRYSNGGLYKTLGFLMECDLKPDYYYTIDWKSLHHKFNFRKQRLISRFPDQNLTIDMTEREMTEQLGYVRIYGAGLKRWELDLT